MWLFLLAMVSLTTFLMMIFLSVFPLEIGTIVTSRIKMLKMQLFVWLKEHLPFQMTNNMIVPLLSMLKSTTKAILVEK